MPKTVIGIWHFNKILCPRCRVQPGSITDYGIDKSGYWFQAQCPHCQAAVRWYKDHDLQASGTGESGGEQLTLFVQEQKIKGKESQSRLAFPEKR